MSDQREEIEAQLSNLRGIEPLVSSMRILSMSNMHYAANHLVKLTDYRREFLEIYRQLEAAVPALPDDFPEAGQAEENPEAILVIFGGDRGFCGTYDKQLIATAEQWQAQQQMPTRILSFGTRMNIQVRYSDLQVEDMGSMITGATPRYDYAAGLVRGWLTALREGRLASVEVLSFQKISGVRFAPQITGYLPDDTGVQTSRARAELPWPPAIIEGDPRQMIRDIRDHLHTILFFELILASLQAENTIRFSLLEEAKENTNRMMEELTMELMLAKRQAITAQIQEIAVSAGLTSSGSASS